MARRRSSLLLELIVYRWQWRVIILLTSFLSAVAGLAAPWFQKEFIDRLTGSLSPLHLNWFDSTAAWIVLAFAAMLGAQALAQLTNYLGMREAIFSQGVLGRHLYDRTLALKADTMSRRSVGEVVSLYATDVPGATVFLEQTLPMGAATLFPLILAPFALSAFFQTPLWAPVLAIVAIAFINTALAFRQSRFFYHFKQLAAERTGLVNEWVQNIRTLRILSWTGAFEKFIFSKREIETQNRISMVTNGQVMNAISTSVTFLLNIITLAALSLGSSHQLTPGEILALLWVVGVFLTRPFRQMPWFFTFMFDAWTSLKRLQDFIDTENKRTPVTTLPNTATAQDLALDVCGLCLEVNGRKLLNHIDLQIRRGEFVAVVGEVGSGKSLLMLSLLRETGMGSGRYRLFGQDTHSMNDDQLRSHFAFVPQEGFIMSATLRDNVVFNYETPATEDSRILKSLKLAQFDLSGERVENGLDTEIGERGVNLSGGQRQRVSLARVHAADAQIVLLDDCLSAVDVDTEEKLLAQLLDGEWKDRTRLLVTHRLTVLDRVDRILFMQNGRIRSQGTFEQLNEDADFREFTASLRRLNGEEQSTAFLKPEAPPVTDTLPESDPKEPVDVG